MGDVKAVRCCLRSQRRPCISEHCAPVLLLLCPEGTTGARKGRKKSRLLPVQLAVKALFFPQVKFKPSKGEHVPGVYSRNVITSFLMWIYTFVCDLFHSLMLFPPLLPSTRGTSRLGFGLQMVHAVDIQKAKTSKILSAVPPGASLWNKTPSPCFPPGWAFCDSTSFAQTPIDWVGDEAVEAALPYL